MLLGPAPGCEIPSLGEQRQHPETGIGGAGSSALSLGLRQHPGRGCGKPPTQRLLAPAGGSLGPCFPLSGRDMAQRDLACRRNLALVKELGDRAAQGRAYGNLGNTHYLLGSFVEATTFHKEVSTAGRAQCSRSCAAPRTQTLGQRQHCHLHLVLGLLCDHPGLGCASSAPGHR